MYLCICTWVSFPSWQPVPEQDKKCDLGIPKQGSLAEVGFICPFSLTPFLARVGIWPCLELGWRTGPGTGAWMRRWQRSRGAVRCSTALGQGLRVERQ